ncbi:type II toxin-antitoxin system Phd/YefM family antitoxin [Nocardia lasii]|uniref:Antitoxin n=1 Tax=Nocardia lasii TaxID=1616107 RepID=A0ABW1JM74_9NOCA
MTALPISTTRRNLSALVQQVNDNHDTVTIVTESGKNAVLVAETEWNSIQESLYVLATHGNIRLLEATTPSRISHSCFSFDVSRNYVRGARLALTRASTVPRPRPNPG